MPRLSKRDIAALLVLVLLTFAAALLSILELPHLALAATSLLIGAVGGLVLLTGASARAWDRRLSREGRQARIAIKRVVSTTAASRETLRVIVRRLTATRTDLATATDAIERNIDALRFSQSVVTQALSTTKGTTAETSELVRANQDQLERLTEATVRFADELNASLASAIQPSIPVANGVVGQHGAAAV